MKVFELTTEDSKQNRHRLVTVGYAMVAFELVFPLTILTIANVHFAVTARDFSGRVIGYMQLFWFLSVVRASFTRLLPTFEERDGREVPVCFAQ